MLPFQAQGATMAIEDARTLGAQLGGTDDVSRALTSYSALRQPRTARVQSASRQNGQRFHQDNRTAHLRLWLLGRLAPGVYHRHLDWLYGHRLAGEPAGP